jgi:hypothetical protein
MAKGILITISTVLLWVGVVQVVAADDVSPELASKAGLYLLEKYHYEKFDKGFGVQVSEPKIYPSYNGLRQYYVVFAYSGPGDIPKWADLEGDPEKYRSRNKWFQHFIFPTTKREPVVRRISGGIPRTIRFRREAEEVIRSKRYFPPPTYSRTVIEGTEVYFVFSSGEKDYLVNYGGWIVTPPNIPGAPIPVDVEKSRNETNKFWEDVEKFNPDGGL